MIYQGIGFQYFENGVRIEPAYCDNCEIVAGKDTSKAYCKCPRCRRKMTFYEDEVQLANNEVDAITEMASRDYLEEKEYWHCPRCKQETLRFESRGLWD